MLNKVKIYHFNNEHIYTKVEGFENIVGSIFSDTLLVHCLRFGIHCWVRNWTRFQGSGTLNFSTKELVDQLDVSLTILYQEKW